MDYLVVGLSHKTAPISLREKLSVSAQECPHVLHDLTGKIPSLKETFFLSTCNRMEVYAASSNAQDSIRDLESFFSHKGQCPLDTIRSHLYTYKNSEAVTHGFKVISSLDSLVVGENQIVGQFRDAFEIAFKEHVTGTYLNQFVNRAFYVSKKVRENTAVSLGAVSVGSVAVLLTRQIYGTLENKSIGIVGAGEIAELVVRHLSEHNIGSLHCFNRTQAKAQELAFRLNGQAHSLDNLENILEQGLDIVVTAIESDKALLLADQLQTLMHKRKNRSLILIDLGVPRNINADCNNVDNVFLYNIDDLKQVIEHNSKERQKEAEKAFLIVEKEASRFMDFMVARDPTLVQLGAKWDGIRKKELERTMKKLSHLNKNDLEAVEKMTEAILNRILFDPVLSLKNEAGDERSWQAKDLIRKMFRLDESDYEGKDN
ncbi:glutamyl-tRNA reductase [bacterium]|nr:glutamyl-tRNA reductase [bacterium]